MAQDHGARNLDTAVGAHLRRVAQRYTAGRKALVTALANAARPLTMAELTAAEPGLPQSTTYRNLAVLEQAGVVHRVTSSDEFGRFELAEELTGRHHHHLVCTSCGSVEDFEVPGRIERGIADVVNEFSAAKGFRANAHRLDLLGTCEACTR